MMFCIPENDIIFTDKDEAHAYQIFSDNGKGKGKGRNIQAVFDKGNGKNIILNNKCLVDKCCAEQGDGQGLMKEEISIISFDKQWRGNYY